MNYRRLLGVALLLSLACVATASAASYYQNYNTPVKDYSKYSQCDDGGSTGPNRGLAGGSAATACGPLDATIVVAPGTPITAYGEHYYYFYLHSPTKVTLRLRACGAGGTGCAIKAQFQDRHGEFESDFAIARDDQPDESITQFLPRGKHVLYVYSVGSEDFYLLSIHAQTRSKYQYGIVTPKLYPRKTKR